jgi:hypothetical protein
MSQKQTSKKVLASANKRLKASAEEVQSHKQLQAQGIFSDSQYREISGVKYHSLPYKSWTH